MLAVLLVLGCAWRGAGDDAPARADPGSIEAYSAIVSLYRAGRTSDAIAELNRWRLHEIEAAVDAAHGADGWSFAGPRSPGRRTVEAAVVLHADLALASWLRSAPIEHDAHLQAALQLMSRLRDTVVTAEQNPSEAPITTRELYVALAAAELSVDCPGGAETLAEKGLRRHARDPELLLLAGIAQETLAVTFARAGRPREAASALRTAARRLAAAHVAAPSFETRLRLGHVLARRGRAARAQPLLEGALQGARDPRQRYLSALFLGQVHEMRNHPELAARAYRRALDNEPRAQAAQLALAHVKETMAGPDEARPFVLAALTATPREDRSADPWWSYSFGPPEIGRLPLDRLRQRVRLP